MCLKMKKVQSVALQCCRMQNFMYRAFPRKQVAFRNKKRSKQLTNHNQPSTAFFRASKSQTILTARSQAQRTEPIVHSVILRNMTKQKGHQRPELRAKKGSGKPFSIELTTVNALITFQKIVMVLISPEIQTIQYHKHVRPHSIFLL